MPQRARWVSQRHEHQRGTRGRLTSSISQCRAHSSHGTGCSAAVDAVSMALPAQRTGARRARGQRRERRSRRCARRRRPAAGLRPSAAAPTRLEPPPAPVGSSRRGRVRGVAADTALVHRGPRVRLGRRLFQAAGQPSTRRRLPLGSSRLVAPAMAFDASSAGIASGPLVSTQAGRSFVTQTDPAVVDLMSWASCTTRRAATPRRTLRDECASARVMPARHPPRTGAPPRG